jgi:GTP-binding protein
MDAKFVKSVFALKDLPSDHLPEIAIAGKSNVGKSSLLNRLMNRRGLAKTSQTPGKTRCLNYFLLMPEKRGPFHLVDLPGYGYAKVSQAMRDEWGKLIDGYLALTDRPSGLIALFDSRREPTEVDLDWLAWLGQWDRPFLIVLTKCDKLTNSEKAKAVRRWSVEELKTSKPLLSSANDGTGIDKIWQWIDQVRAGHKQAA